MVAPSKVVAIALNTSLYPDDDEARRVIAAHRRRDRPAGRRPRPVRRRPAVAGHPRRRRSACRGSERSRHEVLSLALRDPFRIARIASTARARASRPSSSSCATIGSRASSGWGRATRIGSTARRRRRWRPSCRCCSTRSASPTSTLAGVDRRRPDDGRLRSAAMARPNVPSTSRSTTSSARSLAVPVHELVGLVEGHPADRLHHRHRRAVDRRRACAAGRPISRR